MGQQQDDVGVVMAEAAVLLLLCGAAGVGNADVRGHDDVRCAGVYGWVVEVNGERRAVEELAERDSGGAGIVFEDLDAGCGIGGVVEPEQRDVVFGRPDAGGVVGRFRDWAGPSAVALLVDSENGRKPALESRVAGEVPTLV